MDYLKVAMRDDLAAEDMSQAAPRATVHLIGALSRATFCGQIAVQHVAHAGTDRVVSCADCLSAARHERESPADNTSLTEPASRILRRVSGPDYSGIERRRRPRFIHPAVPTTTSNGEETMKKYVNVLRPDDKTVHVMFDGDIATACGAISAPELVPAPQGKAVSCEHCTKAILNQQRASDHRVAVELTQAMMASGDAELLNKLRQMCGYVENGSSEYVTIGQDDATREWTISIGDSYARNMGKARRYNGTSFHQAIRAAAEKELREEEPQEVRLVPPPAVVFHAGGVIPPSGAAPVLSNGEFEARTKMTKLLNEVKDYLGVPRAKEIVRSQGCADKIAQIPTTRITDVIAICELLLEGRNAEHRFGTIGVKIKRVRDDAKLPTYGTPESACFDFYAAEDGEVGYGAPHIFDIGIQIEPEPGYGMQVFSRSGLGFNEDVRLANCVAVIDGDYRKNLMIKLTMDMPGMTYHVKKGERIAQGMFVPVIKAVFTEAEELSVTQRDGGLGSTGKM